MAVAVEDCRKEIQGIRGQLSDVMRVFCVPVTDWEEAVRLLQLCKAAIEGLEGRCAAEAGSHGEEV